MGVRTGLVSVTFRQLPADEVVEVAAKAGLAAIEWGGDVHVPLGNLVAAQRVKALSEVHGLEIAAYGSYLRAGSVDREEMRSAVATAEALGAPRIRVWAGNVGTAEAGVGDRMAVTRGLAELADVAATAGIEVALEFHRNTLTDEVDSTITLLLDVGAPNLKTYWQPPVDLDDAQCLRATRGADAVAQHGARLLLVAVQHPPATSGPGVPVAPGPGPPRRRAPRDQRPPRVRRRRLPGPVRQGRRRPAQLGL